MHASSLAADAASAPVARLPARILRPPSNVGLLLGVLFFAASLTPSLIPRTPAMQGLLAGFAMAAGYGIGVFLCWTWRYLALPVPPLHRRAHITMVLRGVCLLIFLVALWRAPHWQNMVRQVFGMAPIGRAVSLQVGATALVVFAALLGGVRLVWGLSMRLSTALARRLPHRLANLLGVLVVVALVVFLGNRVLLRVAMQLIDSSFRQADALLPPEEAPPRSALQTGGPGSLIAWESLGRMGRRFIASTPEATSITEVARSPARSPLRVYAGLPSAPTTEERARLALEELKRVGGFSRRALVIITPTGTGWVDPGAIESIEYLMRGDVASVAMQYSYLSSPLSLLIEPEYGEETSQALFRAVYGYWRTLPKDRRPRLYLHGLSLGAMNSERSLELLDVLGDPPQGALWSGPPFASTQWRRLTLVRNPGTPAWLPEVRDGSFVRFMNQHGPTVADSAPWGSMRVVYLQYASDAVTFYNYRDAFRTPAWLYPTRGPDVAPQMRWYPIVSMMQVALDMILANDAPMGYGHVFAPSHYVSAWRAVASIDDWRPYDVARLQRTLDARRSAELARDEDEGGG